MNSLWDTLWKEEQVRMEQISSRVIDDILNGKTFEPRKVYPEFRFSEPYSFWRPFAPVHFFFPFFKQIIVNVTPFIDKEKFRSYYGMTSNNLISVIKGEKVIPICSRKYEDFPKW